MIKIRMLVKKCRGLLIPLLLVLTAVILNITGWSSHSFCDWYTENIFPVWLATYGRIMGVFPFSVGEWMLYAAVVLLVVLPVWGMVTAAFWLLQLIKRKTKKCVTGDGTGASDKMAKRYGKFARFIFWIVGIVSLEMTFTCFFLFHVSPMNERYEIGAKTRDEYGLAEIEILRDYVVEQANALAKVMERDEKGYLIYNGNIADEAKKQMQRLGEMFPNLKGFYPNPKPLYTSEFFSQQYMMGYYFPFSMEANYNEKMYIINLPATMCHELSHLKGFLLEDEANFIAYLACVDAEDDFFKYSAYLSVLSYLDRDFYKAAGEDALYYSKHPAISGQVAEDDKFLTDEAWKEVEEDAVLDTEFVKEVSDKVLETNLTLNGVKDSKVSYSQVVDLLLQYYDGILY